MGRRALLLLVAIVIAATGSFLVYLYASKADARAVQGQHPVAVLVARRNIQAGTTGAAAQNGGLIVKKTIARADAVSTALAPDNLTSINGKVALSNIYAGEQILTVQFGNAGQTPGGFASVPGTVAVSVQLSDPARVAGFVSPGSDVAVFVTTTPRRGPDAGTPVTQLLFAKARVVGVGQSTVGRSAGSTPASGTAGGAGANPEQVPRTLVTLALIPSDAQKLVFAATQGSVYLALLPANSTAPTPLPAISGRTLFPGGTG